jgi:tetratricopeptide (TPR) repeat protein
MGIYMSCLVDLISLEDVEKGDVNVGWNFFVINNWWEARITFSNAIDNGNCDDNTIFFLGFSLYKTGETNRGLDYLFSAFEKNQSPRMRIGLAAALAEENRCEESLNLFEGINWAKDSKPIAAEVEAICLIQSDQIQKSIPFLEIVSNFVGNYSAGHLNLGLGLACIGKMEEALERVQLALDIDKQQGEILRPFGLDGVQLKATETLIDLLVESKNEQINNTNLAAIFEISGSLLSRRDDPTQAHRLLEAAVEIKPTARRHYLLAEVLTSMPNCEGAKYHARAAIKLSKEGDPVKLMGHKILAEAIKHKLEMRNKRLELHAIKIFPQKLSSTHLECINYPGISVLYTNDLNGGGPRLVDDYLNFIKKRYGHVDKLFEWCAGPGYLGYAMLAHNLTNRICLADINPKAIHYANMTRKENCLEDRVEIYESNNMDKIPEHEKWDLVIGNPPHYGGPSDYFSEVDRRGWDKNWNIHRRFFAEVGPHLKPEGRLCIVEWEDDKVDFASTPDLFIPMLEENGLMLEDTIKCKEVADHYYLIARKK